MKTTTDRTEAIRNHCTARGYVFAPWSPTPWETDSEAPPPWSVGTAYARDWPKIWRLRKRIERDLFKGAHDSAD